MSRIKTNHEDNFTDGLSYLISGNVPIIIGLGNALPPFGTKSLSTIIISQCGNVAAFYGHRV